MGYIISEDCLVCGDKTHLFKTEDGVDIFNGDYAYWCGYRNNHWINFGKIKASKLQAKLLVGENIINKVFSSPELSNEFYLKSKEIKCIGRWGELPDRKDHEYHIAIDIGDNKEMFNYLTACVCHIEDKKIVFDYSKTIKLENTFKLQRNREIEILINEISHYFNGCNADNAYLEEDGGIISSKY